MSIKDKVQKKNDDAFGTVDLIISFKNDKEIDVKKFNELRKAGNWIKSSGSHIRVQTTLSPKDLATLIKKETGIYPNDFTITNAAGLYVPFV